MSVEITNNKDGSSLCASIDYEGDRPREARISFRARKGKDPEGKYRWLTHRVYYGTPVRLNRNQCRRLIGILQRVVDAK
jgi:hypothetical protein